MKKLLAVFAVLFLTACIPVGDFGGYWAKGFVDPDLLGKWDALDKNDDAVHVSRNGGMYRIDSLDRFERTKKDYQPVDAKALRAGKYLFLMMKDDNKKSGKLIRYIVRGNMFFLYVLDQKATASFLKKHYPRAKNIKRPACRKKCLFDAVRIVKFDAEVYKILSEIPDTKEYWTSGAMYRRHLFINK